MSANIITVYAVHDEDDSGYKRGVQKYCSTASLATEAAKGRGSWGGNAGTSEAKAVEIDGKLYILASEHPIDLDGVQAKADAELKAQTLANLSAEQKRVLGLK